MSSAITVYVKSPLSGAVGKAGGVGERGREERVVGLKHDLEQRPSTGKICTLFENVLTPEVSEMAHLMV